MRHRHYETPPLHDRLAAFLDACHFARAPDLGTEHIGGLLLADALKRLARVSRQLGLAVILLDVLDCGDAGRTARRKALYESYGFRPLPSRSLRLFLPMADALKL